MTGLWLLPLWLAASPAGNCSACHVGPDKGQVDGKAFHASVHGELACTDCHADVSSYPHPKRVAKPECASCHDDPAKSVAASIHGSFGAEACASCHGKAHAIARPSTAACAACHEDIPAALARGVHAPLHGKTDRPSCSNCHGKAHTLQSHTDPRSPVAKPNLPTTCGTCHANPDFLSRHVIPLARPVEAYRLSVHGRAVASGNLKAATCSDCHGSHDIRLGSDGSAPINHFRVPETCGKCHTEIRAVYADSVHGEAVRRGSQGAPVCTDCHGEHAILAPSEPGSPVNPARVSTATCGRCHADTRLAAKYNLPLDKVPAFENSYHGLAMRGGSQSVANCASCHGVHNILRASDPRSTINPKNLAKTCGACHAGAGTRFAIGRVHVLAASRDEHPIVRMIRVSYVRFIIPVTIGLMLLHQVLDFFAKLVRGSVRGYGTEEVERMGLHFRIAHLLVGLSFPTLVLTGFALTFPDTWWAALLAPARGLVHRIAAVVLILAMLYHGVHLALSRRDRKILWHLWPTLQDATDAWALVRHNLGFKVARPVFGKFSYAEKAEYWAFMWGSAVMAASGVLLWFNTWSLTYLPKWASDAATAVHFYEAVLASLAILVWHFYFVIFDPEVYPMERSWITGRMSADHLRHTRPAYFRALSSAAAPPDKAAPPAESSTPPEPGNGET